jgi:hypothetical protein
MVRPCVARSFVDLVFGLASMYPASDWSGVLLRATMDISARSISLADRPRQAKGVTRFRSRREDRSPSLRYLSQTSAGKGLSASLLRHRQLLISSVPWFVLMAVPSSRPDPRHATRAGTVKAGPPGPLAELGLDRAEHGAMIMQVWSNHRLSSSLRSLVPWRAPPRRCARACWRVRSPARCGAAASLRPRSTT